MRRVSELCDVWFDSGAMPVAQWHYPAANREQWETYRQADFICEAVDQTRGWFYTLHAVSTLLFDRPAFKNVICLGHILAEDGSKMSKSRGNVVNPWQVFADNGVDATRWYMYTAGPPGNPRRFSSNLVAEVKRRFLNTLWNTYSFFTVYANLAGSWKEQAPAGRGDLSSAQASAPALLDGWLHSELNRLVREVTAAYEAYDVTAGTRPIAEFVDLLSNWYVRLNRRRLLGRGPGRSQYAAPRTGYRGQAPGPRRSLHLRRDLSESRGRLRPARSGLRPPGALAAGRRSAHRQLARGRHGAGAQGNNPGTGGQGVCRRQSASAAAAGRGAHARRAGRGGTATREGDSSVGAEREGAGVRRRCLRPRGGGGLPPAQGAGPEVRSRLPGDSRSHRQDGQPGAGRASSTPARASASRPAKRSTKWRREK